MTRATLRYIDNSHFVSSGPRKNHKGHLVAVGDRAFKARVTKADTRQWAIQYLTDIPEHWPADADATIIGVTVKHGDYQRLAESEAPVVVEGDLRRPFVRQVSALARKRLIDDVALLHDNSIAIARNAAVEKLRRDIAIGLLKQWGTGSPRLTRALHSLLTGTRNYTIDSLAFECGISRRTLYRQLQDVGISNPKVLIRASRVLRLLRRIYNPEIPLKQVAFEGGYRTPYDFQRDVRLIFKHTPRDIRFKSKPRLLRAPVIKTLLELTSKH